MPKKQSERWQLEASLPEETFDHYVDTTKAAQEELTLADLGITTIQSS